MAEPDPIALAQAMIRCPSVTPADAGALSVLETALKPLGFTCHRLRFEEAGAPATENLYARIGAAGPHFCFAGHTDVVPPGDAALWRSDPFAAEIRGDVLYGRGAVDMKSSIAAFVGACARHLAKGPPKGSISLLISGDEEGTAINGTPKLLAWLKERGERIDHCIVGEPTSVARSGDMVKIGRRGSINTRLVVRGLQGHVGYPHQAKNPIPVLAELIGRLSSHTLDSGTEHFDPSTLAFTTVDVGNPASNVIPAEARAAFNIRFNDRHSPESLEHWIAQTVKEVGETHDCEITVDGNVGGVAFLTQPGAFTDLICETIRGVTGQTPVLSTTGGTSDARFIKDYCPVAELGLPGGTMHKTDECVPLAEIHTLADIFTALLGAYFDSPPLA